MNRQVLTNLRKLSLGSMSQALEHQLEQPGTYEDLGFTERLGLLVDHELQCRHQRRLQRLIKGAGFRLAASLDDIDYRASRGLSRQQIAELGHCGWIEKAQNLLITGPCGSGKSHVACALGRSACLLNHDVRYLRLPSLLSQFDQARATGSYHQFIQRLGQVSLVIIDDWGLQPLTAADRRDLMELMDVRYGRRSVAMVSQLPVDSWHSAIGDPTLADAILDRLIHNAHRIALQGESMRKRNALEPAATHEPGPA